MNGFRGKKRDSAATSRCVLLFRFVAQGIAPPPEKLNETNPSVFSRVRLTTVKASWVVNKHLLVDGPLEKLDDAGKIEAKRQYDEELKLQEQINHHLKCMGGLVREQLKPGAQQRAVLAALMKQQKQPQQHGLARREMSQEGLH